MNNIDKYIKEIHDVVKKLKERDENCNIAYRGEPMNYGNTKLMPSLFRNPDYIDKERKLFQLLKDYGVTEEGAEQAKMLIEAQHYVAISRALDITFSIIPALYFCCCSHPDKDAILYVFGFPEYVSPHSEYIDEYYQGGDAKVYPHNFKVISHAAENERIINQKGGFIFFPGNDFVPINAIYYKEVVIKAQDKGQVIEDLDLLFGVNEAFIYPDIDKIAKQIVKPKFELISPSEDDISIDREIDNAFSRIIYETRMGKKENKKNDFTTLRRLRKEMNDLCSFIEDSVKDETQKDELIRKVNSRCTLLGGR